MINSTVLIKTIKQKTSGIICFAENISKKTRKTPEEILSTILGLDEMSLDVADLISEELGLTVKEYGNIFFAY